MRRLSLVFFGAVSGVALTLLVLSPGGAARAASDVASRPISDDTYRQLQLFGDIFDAVRGAYVDKPDAQKLINAAINGMVKSLDPHSSYMDAAAYSDMQEETSGEFGGLGIEVSAENGLVKVVTPIDGTPAARAGLQANDLITDVDGAPVKDLSLQQVVGKLRGPPGSKVRLKITRKDQAQPIEVVLTREVVRIRTVSSRVEGGDIGYIRLTQFNERAADEVTSAIGDLSKQISPDKLKGFVVDLRNNPGGLLDQAVAVSNAFLSRGEIVSMRGRNPEDVQRFGAKPKPGDLTKGKPLIVLINGGSASASEIVAGALQDQKRATILGTRSFGKGSVQTIIPLGPGKGALRVTTARYFTPSGRSIQALGITPDIEVPQIVPEDIAASNEAASEANLPGHLKAEGQEEKGSQSYIPADPKDDKALHAALDLLRGIMVNPAFPPSENVAQRKPTGDRRVQ